jgi:hypothetical protein
MESKSIAMLKYDDTSTLGNESDRRVQFPLDGEHIDCTVDEQWY